MLKINYNDLKNKCIVCKVVGDDISYLVSRDESVEHPIFLNNKATVFEDFIEACRHISRLADKDYVEIHMLK